MDFGAVSDPACVHFGLPPLTADALRVLGTGRGGSLLQPGWLRAGAPVWARRDWVGTFYPPGTAARSFLPTYAAQAGAVELNATFYAEPSADVVAGWVAATPPTFRFCAKVPRQITHDLELAGPTARAAFASFCAALAPLGPRRGPLLLQMPPSFGPSRLRALDAFLEDAAQIAKDVRLAVELREEGWFDFGALIPEAAHVLERQRAMAVITDTGGRRDVCHGSLTTPSVFVRFVGNAGAPSDDTRLCAWVDRLIGLRAQGLDEAYVFVHQPDDRDAPAALDSFAKHAAARGVDLPRVRPWAKQLSLFG